MNYHKYYFRKDRLNSPRCKIKKKVITKSLAWCDDSTQKKYNEEIQVFNKKSREKFFRIDNKYDYLITINHNEKKIPYKGSAIFLHLTDDYKPTAGCIALKRKDFEILLKLIDKNTKIQIG